MRAKVGKALREQFTAAIQAQVSGFEIVNDKWAGKQNRLFKLETAGTLAFFLFLQLDDKVDQFVIEAGWSTTGRYPIDNLGDEPTAAAVNCDQLRFRIAYLWCGKDSWWVLAPPWTDEDWDNWLFHDEELPEEPIDVTVSKVPAAVEDAIKKIRRYVLPYFRKVAARHGLKLDVK